MQSVKMWTTILWILIILIPSAEAQPRQVNMAIGGHFPMAAFHLATAKGYYKQESLEVNLVVMGAAISNQALISGNVAFSAAGGAALPAMLAGAPMRIIFTSTHRPAFSLWTKQPLRDIRELKGKTVAIPGGFGSGPDTNLREIFRKYGIDEGREVTIMSMAGSQVVFPALQTGSVDAGVLAPQFSIRAREAGLRELLVFNREDLDLVHHQGSIVVREELLKSDARLVESFVRGTLKGLLYVLAHPAGVIPVWSRQNRIREEDGEKIFTQFLLPAMTKDGTVTKESQQKTLDQYTKRAGPRSDIALEKIFDFSIARRARAELDVSKWRPARE